MALMTEFNDRLIFSQLSYRRNSIFICNYNKLTIN